MKHFKDRPGNHRRTTGMSVTGKLLCILLLTLPFSICGYGQGQDTLPELTIEEAVEIAVKNYPRIRSAELEIDQYEALKGTAWDLGYTRIYTNGEELDPAGGGVYTLLGIGQEDMDLFGIAPRKNLYEQRIALAEAALQLTAREVKMEVQQAYVNAYITYRYLDLYARLDSIFAEFEKSASLRYEVEEISRLAYLAAINRSRQITLKFRQAEYDHASALQKLNLWFASDTFYTVQMENGEWMEPLIRNDSLNGHPAMVLASEKIALARAETKVAKAGYLPKISAQYGIQQVNGEGGFYRYQLGISFPLFFLPQKSRVEAAQIRQEIMEEEYQLTELRLESRYRALIREYKKWLASWRYYQEEALPLAREQRQGALIAWEEGAITYTAFIRNIQDAIQIEVDANQALQQYLMTKYALIYFNDMNDKN